MTLHEIARLVERARTPEQVFGGLTGDLAAQRHAVAFLYRSWSKVVHPDFYSGADRELAERVFRRITEYKDLAMRKIEADRYGKPDAILPRKVHVKIKTREYTVDALLATGDYADIYRCTWMVDGCASDPNDVGVFKIVKSPADNDLADDEATMLNKVMSASKANDAFCQYFPRPRDRFTLKGSSGQHRRVIVLELLDTYIPMSTIFGLCPDGLDFRDVVWMYKRVLAGLGFAHRAGVIHGAVIPPHLMVHPVTHGAKIIDWSAATTGAPVKYVSAKYRDFYAPEVLDKKPPSPATDIFMAAKCAVSLMRGQSKHLPIPTAIRRFFDGCLFVNPSRRPQDAWALHEEFDELLLKVVGPRKYRPLRIPGMAF